MLRTPLIPALISLSRPWSPESRINKKFREHTPHSLSFSSDGELVAACGYDSRRDGEENRYITTVFNLNTQETRQVLVSPRMSLFGGNLGRARLIAVSVYLQLWNAETGEVLKTVVKAPHA